MKSKQAQKIDQEESNQKHQKSLDKVTSQQYYASLKKLMPTIKPLLDRLKDA